MNNQATIAELKARGFQVKVSHKRPIRVVPYVGGKSPDDLFTRHDLEAFNDGSEIEIDTEFEPRGGVTTVTILNADGDTLGVGEARCRPDESFNKRLGLAAALGRALKDARQSAQI